MQAEQGSINCVQSTKLTATILLARVLANASPYLVAQAPIHNRISLHDDWTVRYGNDLAFARILACPIYPPGSISGHDGRALPAGNTSLT